MTLVEANNTLVGQVELLRQRGAAPSWIEDLRRRGADHFDRVGVPTTKDEEWRLTDVRSLGQGGFALAEPGDVSADILRPFQFPGLDAHLLVFVDGRLNAEFSSIGELPSGVSIAGMAEQCAGAAELVRPHLAKHATPESEPFVALNSAYLDDGAFIHVAAGVQLQRPVHLLFVSTDSDQPTMTHPRVLMVAGDRARMDVIEHHVTLAPQSSNTYFTNAVTEVVVGEDAEVSHYFIERESAAAYNVSTLQVHQQRQSRFTSHSVLIGGKVVRNNVRPVLAGDHVWSMLNGLYLPDGDRLIDNHMYVHHQAPNCESRQYYTGVLRDESTGIFIGRIKVERPAQKTDAVQSSRNLLMSDGTHAHNRPQLEIFADDVKCTHGSTTGQIDEQSIFYLRSRGVPEAVARGMLVFAFANESLDRMAIEPVRRELARLLVQELGLGSEVESVIE